MKYSDEQRIKKIYENASKLNEYIKSNKVTKDRLMDDYALQWLVTTPLYNIGEHAYHISDDFKNLHADIEWNMIAGLRHRLIHDYDGTNWNIIADVVLDEIPLLIEKIKELSE
ncbi:HepT-like ribonuclease domain-containing protein [Oribacterium sp. NK2B42]|uniref:HepT-like ribonuclease domain-containing protein n=1 Tax=Oribacterium sp. NK2B42 TaxID=689781 RepID=UPI000411498F|nr:HepT-like ribonuclease domain-containing protein [Oribacterium sp. NK2B42]